MYSLIYSSVSSTRYYYVFPRAEKMPQEITFKWTNSGDTGNPEVQVQVTSEFFVPQLPSGQCGPVPSLLFSS